jgi:O-acetyl-ADP-ribose deacetylase (regulator of RNase III)
VSKRRTPKIYLRDTNENLVFFWKKYFKPFPEVEISLGNIFEIKAEAIVSPANSFGYMDGGIDLLYRDKFGLNVEKLVQKNIDLHYYGELPIGQALSVPMRGQDYKYLIVAPTMRLPMVVDTTLNAYNAFRATLLLAKDKQIESIVCPGLGTGTGQACPEMVARQMFVAYLTIVVDRSFVKPFHLARQMNWMLRCAKDKIV